MDPTNPQEVLEFMRQMQADLPPVARATVRQCVAELHAMVKRHGPLASIAIGQVSAELSLQSTDLTEKSNISQSYRGADDDRYVYGVTCTWHGWICNAGSMVQPEGSQLPDGLPCCPHCSGPLYELPSKAEWDVLVQSHEDRGVKNYRVFTQWRAEQPRCYKSLAQAAAAYEQETGVKVALPG
jgi:hypothetical protein